MTTTDHISAWARFQASKSDASRAKRDAFLASLDRFPAWRPPFTAEQQQAHDALQRKLDECAPNLSALALDWLYLPPQKKVEAEAAAAPGGYESWLTADERRLIRHHLPQGSGRKNAVDLVSIADWSLASIATNVPLSRHSEAMSAAFNRACRKGAFDILAEAIEKDELSELSQSRIDQLRRLCRQASRQGKALRDRDKQRKASSDLLAKSRRKGATA